MDVSGNLYFADQDNNRVRKIDLSGHITTVAGNGTAGYSGDGAMATAAELSKPGSVCMDTYGDLFIADNNNSRIRKVDINGIITTVAGGGSSTSNNILATTASLGNIRGVCTDNNNNIYVPDRSHYRVCKVNTQAPPPAAQTADSFGVYLSSSCSGTFVSIAPNKYSSSLLVKTWFGDGNTETDTFASYSYIRYVQPCI